MQFRSIKNLYQRTLVETQQATGGDVIVNDGLYRLNCTRLQQDLERNQVLLPFVPNALTDITECIKALPPTRQSFCCPGGSPDRLTVFRDHGYDVRSLGVMQWQPSTKDKPLHSIRVLSDAADWHAATALRYSMHAAGMTAHEFQRFTQRRMEIYRAACEAGLGQWYGVFVQNNLVSTCGIMCPYGHLARFRLVLTHPRYRHNGYASSLIYGAAMHAQDVFRPTAILIAAERQSPAQRLYEKLGFQEVQTAFQVTRTAAIHVP